MHNAIRFLSSKTSLFHKPNKVLHQFSDEAKLFMPKTYSKSYTASRLNISDVKELDIPMPYGKLAAKAWGSETGQPVLAFHGWLDNCGTFDRLMPLLSNNFYVVALDAPGHGRSSHKFPGSVYSDIDAILDYRKVVDYLGWDKFYLMGHSFGGALALLFSCVFPDLVEKVVAIDIAKPISAPLTAFPEIIRKAADELLKIESKLSKAPPVYTPEKACERLIQGMHNEVTIDGVKILLKRGARPSECGKGVVFSRDLRCRTVEFINIKSHELVFQHILAMKCEVMLIMATHTHPNYQSDKPETLEQVYDIYRKNMKRFVLEYVEGNHFVHLNNPERVAPLIDKFLGE